MDPAPETIRAVRDTRFKYVRNYRPDLPYIGYIPYRDQAGIMQEILRLRDEKKLDPDQWQFWATKKPLEELYDTEVDPYEIHNLASDPRYFEKLAELRDAHERWTAETGDLGHIPESELIRRLYPPDGTQPTTADPEITTRRAEGKRVVTIASSSAGASIAYRVGAEDRWRLYVEPFEAAPGTVVRAGRIGSAGSPAARPRRRSKSDPQTC